MGAWWLRRLTLCCPRPTTTPALSRCDFLAGMDQIPLSTPLGAVALPEPLRQVLTDAAEALASGHAVTVEPRRTVLTTSEAADLLEISRPTFVRLIESGKIPFTAPVRHRRVELADVLKFQQDGSVDSCCRHRLESETRTGHGGHPVR